MNNDEIVYELYRALSEIQRSYFSLDDTLPVNSNYEVRLAKIAAKEAYEIIESLAQKIGYHSD